MPDNPEPESPVPSLEAGLEEIAKIVKELEASDLPLEKSIQLLEKGMRLIQSCRKQLEEAETRVEILLKRNGTLQPEPFQPDKA